MSIHSKSHYKEYIYVYIYGVPFHVRRSYCYSIMWRILAQLYKRRKTFLVEPKSRVGCSVIVQEQQNSFIDSAQAG